MAATKDLIDLHIRTYRSVLRSSQEIAVTTLISTYLKMDPLLHSQAADPKKFDVDALNYCFNRLPKEITETKLIVIGQNKESFKKAGYNIDGWKFISAAHRRRPTFYNSKTKTMAQLVASISDIDDIVNLAIAYQIESNKLAVSRSKHSRGGVNGGDPVERPQSGEDVGRDELTPGPQKLKNLKLKLLEGSWTNFAKTAEKWWQNLVKKTSKSFDLENQPIIFVSSNNHSLINLLDGFCLKHKKEIVKKFSELFPNQFVEINQPPFSPAEQDPASRGNNQFLTYYLSQFVFANDKKLWKEKIENEEKMGIVRIPAGKDFAIETQIIPGRLLNEKIRNAAILNIEYPLGFAAFHTLEEVLENKDNVLGVYILGKAAALNTKVGDILIPKIVFDEHTQNTYLTNNCFNNNFPCQFKDGSILDNQRLVSVIGPFLENKDLLDEYSKKEFNVVEMEAGPYLGAVAQATYTQPLAKEAVVDLNKPPFDLGLIYYSSDNPYTLSQNIGSLMGATGIEATYLSTKAIIERIKKIV